MSTEEVDRLLGSIMSGNVNAYEKIVRTFQKDVWRIVAFGFREIETTEDLVQQVFVKAYFKLDQFRKGKDFGAWLRAIARNLVREELRRRDRYRRRLAVYHESLMARYSDNGRADRYEASLRKALKECCEALAPSAGKALHLRYKEAKGFGEIAQILGRTVAATRQMLGRIRLSLRSCIEERMAES